MHEPKFINLFRQQPRFEHDGYEDHREAYNQAAELERVIREIIRDELDRQAHQAMRKGHGYS